MMTADKAVNENQIVKNQTFQYFMSPLETISAKVFDILYSAWKLFQLQRGKSLFELLPVSEEVALGP